MLIKGTEQALKHTLNNLAIIEHEGSMTSDGESQGHYICDVKCKETNSWFRTNDNQNPVAITCQSVTKNAVVILYKRK